LAPSVAPVKEEDEEEEEEEEEKVQNWEERWENAVGESWDDGETIEEKDRREAEAPTEEEEEDEDVEEEEEVKEEEVKEEEVKEEVATPKRHQLQVNVCQFSLLHDALLSWQTSIQNSSNFQTLWQATQTG